MDLFEVLRQRHSCRAYQNRPISDADLTRVLEAANAAPSAGNLQAYEIVLVRDTERKRKLARAALDQSFIAEAPVALVFLTNPDRNRVRYGKRGSDLYALQDATLACAYAQLAATALGLATCWVGAFDEKEVGRIVGAPPDARPVAILPVGYAGESAEPRTRRPLSELTHSEHLRD